jgi:predicted RNA binding protein YcfA (HicA-like mRNA interferase family)
MSSNRKEMREVIRRAQRQGWTITQTGGDHLKWVSPSGSVVFCSSTPSDRRAMKNHTSMLRRHGFNLMEK